MLSLTINIKNINLKQKVLEVLKSFEKDGLEIISKEDFEDFKLLQETRNDKSIPFEEYLNDEGKYWVHSKNIKFSTNAISALVFSSTQ